MKCRHTRCDSEEEEWARWTVAWRPLTSCSRECLQGTPEDEEDCRPSPSQPPQLLVSRPLTPRTTLLSVHLSVWVC